MGMNGDDIRVLLHRGVETLEPSSDLWERTQECARRHIVRRVVARVTVTVLAVFLSIGFGARVIDQFSQPPVDVTTDLDAVAPGIWDVLNGPPIAGRIDHTATWVGDRMVVWGGATFEDGQTRLLSDGAILLPDGGWEPIAESPLSPRRGHSAVWTEQELLVVGGLDAPHHQVSGQMDGAAYDLDSNSWRLLPAVPGFAARADHTAVRTNEAMIIWGGRGAEGALDDGALYDASRGEWRRIGQAPLEARFGHTAVWTGEEMIVWGGVGDDGTHYRDGAAYDPATDQWRVLAVAPLAPRDGHSAVWTGSAMLIWGGTGTMLGDAGRAHPVTLNDGAAYEPKADSWTPMAPSPLGSRTGHTAVWTDQRMLVWGGLCVEGASRRYANDGTAFDPAGGTWVRTPPALLSGPRA